ncbi:MAG: endopeptidase La [Candidatus Poribacteria bacterium]|nr:endopeptidase La [Candidatus Poribacteria bacterium]
MNPDSRTNHPVDEVCILPVIPLPGKVIFPRANTPLNVIRQIGVRAAKYATRADQDVILLNQKETEKENPDPDDFYRVGTAASITDSYDPGDGTIRIAIEGYSRAIMLRCFETNGFLKAEVKIVPEESDQSKQAKSLMKAAISDFEAYAKANRQQIPAESLMVVQREAEPGYLADSIANFMNIDSDKLQRVLDEINPIKRLQVTIEILKEELDLLKLDEKINTQVRKSVERTHREFYLQEKMKAIQKELGRGDDVAEIDELREQIKSAGMTEEAEEKVLKEVDRLQQMPPMSAESGVIRTYIDWFLALPWTKRTEDKIDLNEAERILEEDHYGLDKPKERILEYLAVLQLVQKLKGPILCFVGPPGVGKTSLGKSIARATGRNFIRMSLGGVHDEAEIRGHRRTYIGSLPGRILQGLRDAKSKNPLFLLDEIDKISMDFRGDPASALLEVLDPEQNDTFRDHYLDVQFDLSEIMFITTANTQVTIPPALLDRMEIIELPGYTEYEKHKIASLFLIPKQIKAHGLKEEFLSFSDDAIFEIIHKYTREAGVRNLERETTGICRKVAREVVKEGNNEKNIHVDVADLQEYLGPPKFIRGKAEERDEVGVATGMVYTQAGGDIIAIEATQMTGDGVLALTGQLGEIMRESAQTALAYIRSRADLLSLPTDFHFEKHDIHIHIPEGAVPKEGPSAGITLATAMISALTGREVRKDIAMTGEITLRGRVLPIGGLKEKVLAAHRNSIKNIIIPEDNDKDLPEIPEEIRNNLQFYKVRDMTEVLDLALKKPDAPENKDVTGDNVPDEMSDVALRKPDAPGQIPTSEPHH